MALHKLQIYLWLCCVVCPEVMVLRRTNHLANKTSEEKNFLCWSYIMISSSTSTYEPTFQQTEANVHIYEFLNIWKLSTKSTPLIACCYVSELSICMTDDSRMVGMPIAFRCACVKLVISRSSNSTTHKRPDNCRSDDTIFDVLPSQELSVVQIERSLLTGVMGRHLHLILLRIWWDQWSHGYNLLLLFVFMWQ